MDVEEGKERSIYVLVVWNEGFFFAGPSSLIGCQ